MNASRWLIRWCPECDLPADRCAYDSHLAGRLDAEIVLAADLDRALDALADARSALEREAFHRNPTDFQSDQAGALLRRVDDLLRPKEGERPGFWAQADDLADHDPRCRCGRCGDPLRPMEQITLRAPKEEE